MKKKLYAKHFELNFPDKPSASQFYMISRYTDVYYADTWVQSRLARYRKTVTYIYLEDAINIAKDKIKNADVPRILNAWKNMLERLKIIKDNYQELYTVHIENKEYKYSQPSELFIKKRHNSILHKQLRRQEFLNKWRKHYDQIFCL
jgi:cytidylate kinase